MGWQVIKQAREGSNWAKGNLKRRDVLLSSFMFLNSGTAYHLSCRSC